MALQYLEGRMQLRFGPESRFSQLYLQTLQKLEEAYNGLMPDAIIEAILAGFKRKLDPKGITAVSQTELQQMDIEAERLIEYERLENPQRSEQIELEAEKYVAAKLREIEIRSELRTNGSLTALDFYREAMGSITARYIGKRLWLTEDELSKSSNELSKSLGTPAVGATIDDFLSNSRRWMKLTDACQKISAMRDALYGHQQGALLVFDTANGQSFAYDTKNLG